MDRRWLEEFYGFGDFWIRKELTFGEFYCSKKSEEEFDNDDWEEFDDDDDWEEFDRFGGDGFIILSCFYFND